MFSKLAIGPATSVRCRHCHKPVTVSRWSVPLIILFFMLMAGLRLLIF
jgi:hypothetical protein